MTDSRTDATAADMAPGDSHRWPASRWWRLVVLPVSAAVLIGATIYRLQNPGSAITPGVGEFASYALPPAPFLALYNSDKPQKLVRLQSYLGRHPIAVVFFDGRKGVGEAPLLLTLRERFAELQSRRAIILAVSAALPQENRKAFETTGEFPFEILSDPGLEEHAKWGLVDESTGEPRQGAFFINRKGLVEWDGRAPRPVESREKLLELLGLSPE